MTWGFYFGVGFDLIFCLEWDEDEKFINNIHNGLFRFQRKWWDSMVMCERDLFRGLTFLVKFPSLRWSFANSLLVRRWWEYRTHSSLVGIHSTASSSRGSHSRKRWSPRDSLKVFKSWQGRLFEVCARETGHSWRHYQTGQHADCTRKKTKSKIHLAVSSITEHHAYREPR